MEKGTFQQHELVSPILDSDDEISRVPIPSQLPTTPDLSRLPSHILRSGAVEALINQNDDLMARLGVSLRRIATLEESLSQATQTSKKLQFQHDNLQDQVRILEQKAQVVNERKSEAEGLTHHLKEQVRLLEIRYAELYSTSRDRKDELLKKIELLSGRLSRFMRYRQKIKMTASAIKAQKGELLARTEELQQRLESNTVTIEDFKQKLREAANYIQEQKKQAESDQASLVENYETQLTELKSEKARLLEQTSELEKRCDQFDSLYEEKVELDNKLVSLTRQKHEQKAHLEAELESVQSKMVLFRREAKQTTLELNGTKEKNQELESSIAEIKEENLRLTDQVESLQCLWKESQAQSEQQLEKNKSLQKLNQQLSTSLNEYRREIRQLREKLDGKRFDQQVSPNQTPKASQDSASVNASDHERKLDRVETLLAEIQSGFSRSIE